jgi:hypothetical protein
MPPPKSKKIPDYEYWGFIQKDCKTEEELRPLVRNIIDNSGNVLNNTIKENVLNFLSTSNKVKAWSDYWVTIINTLGIGYVDQGTKILEKTSLADYVNGGNPINGFYYYWALSFQFPFAQSKHKGFKDNGIVVQPVISMLEHLVLLFENALMNIRDPFEEAYLSFDEIVLVLSKSKSNSIYEVKKNVNQIKANRLRSYDYSELKIDGYETNYDNFAGRAKLYFEKFNLLRFDGNRILITDWEHYFKIVAFLAYRKEAYILTNDRSSRNEFFLGTFNLLKPNPTHLFNAVDKIDSDYIGGYRLNLVDLLENKLLKNGIYFEKDFIEAFLLSLKTKPFVILSGISGVGKSLLPNSIMKIVGNKECRAIAVSPDWTDNTDMLGYFNINNDFIIGEFTKLILDASENPEIPYYIILDEMNLSKVELYFAQVLSVIESRRFNENTNKIEYDNYLFNDAVRNRFQELIKQAVDEERKAYFGKMYNLKITNNTFIIGTVNIDESTYPFSKKVLDRANVLEINDVNLMLGIDDILNGIVDAPLEVEGSEGGEGSTLTDTPAESSEEAQEQPSSNEPQNGFFEVGEEPVSDRLEGSLVEAREETQEEAQEEVGEEAQEEAQEEVGEEAQEEAQEEAEEEAEEEDSGLFNQDDFVFLNHFFEGKISNLDELKKEWSFNGEINLPMKETLIKWVSVLSSFNDVLKPLKLNFGYRVRDEVCIYLYYSTVFNADKLDRDNNWWYKYFDQQLIQKVFTRLSGEEGEFDKILVSLFNLCSNKQFTQDEILELDIENSSEIKFKKSSLKLQLMLRDLIVYEKPSTSFWSA